MLAKGRRTVSGIAASRMKARHTDSPLHRCSRRHTATPLAGTHAGQCLPLVPHSSPLVPRFQPSAQQKTAPEGAVLSVRQQGRQPPPLVSHSSPLTPGYWFLAPRRPRQQKNRARRRGSAGEASTPGIDPLSFLTPLPSFLAFSRPHQQKTALEGAVLSVRPQGRQPPSLVPHSSPLTPGFQP